MVHHNGLQHIAIELHSGSGTSAIAGSRFGFLDDADGSDFFELLASPNTPWDTLVRTLAKRIAGNGYEHPAIALFEVLPGATACFIFGDIEVEVTTDGDPFTLATDNVSTWLETQIRENVASISVGVVQEDPIGLLRDGYITSGGFVVAVGDASPSEQVPLEESSEPSPSAAPAFESKPEPQPEPEAQPEPESVDFDPTLTTAITGDQLSAIKKEAAIAADTRRASAAGGTGNPSFVLPKLRGIRCSAGHLNSMQDRTCRTCGAEVDQAGAIEDDTRPALAIITFDDGVEFELDTPMVIGRSVPDPYAIGDEVAIPVSLTDETNLISRVHLEIHLTGWDIELIDKASSNGTFSRPLAANATKVRLRPEAPTAIALGSEIEVGGRKFAITAGPLNG